MSVKIPSIRKPKVALAAAVAAFAPLAASAAVLFSDNLDTAGSSTAWQVNVAPAANSSTQAATFGFDYSAYGIPAAAACRGAHYRTEGKCARIGRRRKPRKAAADL